MKYTDRGLEEVETKHRANRGGGDQPQSKERRWRPNTELIEKVETNHRAKRGGGDQTQS